jgi:hypothetical protein
MRSNRNLEGHDLIFRVEREYRRPKREKRKKVQPPAMRKCSICDKWGYFTEDDARIVVGRMLKSGALKGPNTYTFHPYLCPHGFWHLGHDSRSRLWIEAKLEADAEAQARKEAVTM